MTNHPPGGVRPMTRLTAVGLGVCLTLVAWTGNPLSARAAQQEAAPPLELPAIAPQPVDQPAIAPPPAPGNLPAPAVNPQPVPPGEVAEQLAAAKADGAAA